MDIHLGICWHEWASSIQAALLEISNFYEWLSGSNALIVVPPSLKA